MCEQCQHFPPPLLDFWAFPAQDKGLKNLAVSFYHVLPTTIYSLSNICKKTFIEVELEYLLEANNLKVIENIKDFLKNLALS